MSYLHSWVQDAHVFGDITPRSVHPQSWTSPYRWERMFDVFEPESGVPQRPLLQTRHPWGYVSGRVYQDGRVELDPWFLLPGAPRFVPEPFGELALVIQYAGKMQMRIPFTPSFVDSEGNQLGESVFHLNVPVLPNTTRIAVMRGEKVLDEIRVSQYSPKLRIRARPSARRGGTAGRCSIGTRTTRTATPCTTRSSTRRTARCCPNFGQPSSQLSAFSAQLLQLRQFLLADS